MYLLLAVSSSGFYKWSKRLPSKKEIKTHELSIVIKQEFEKSCQIYDSPRITHQLKGKSIAISRSYFGRLMQKLNLRSKIRKKFKQTTDSKHNFKIADNILNGNFIISGLSQKWVGDITYIKTATGWVYFTKFIDLADRKVIGGGNREATRIDI